MARRRPEPDDHDDGPRRRRPDRSWSTRIAWFVLAGGAALVVTRLSVATVVQVHGDGMAPTILDGDHVLFVRGSWGLEPGDIVVYDPTPAPAQGDPDEHRETPVPDGYDDIHGHPDPARDEGGDLRNTAVVDVDELARNWERTKLGADGLPAPAGFRVGRILAAPGQPVTFNAPDGALGLNLAGQPLAHKEGTPMRIVLRGAAPDSDSTSPRLRQTAFESLGSARYTVLTARQSVPKWPALGIPPAGHGPVEVHAGGYLVVADNRVEGACCDSRAIGWIAADRIRGEIILRLPGDPALTPDLDPEARGSRWLP